MPQTQEQWTLTIGIHRGTITSRDSEEPKKMDSLQKCQEEVTRAEARYAELGYYIWYASATGPDGKSHQLKYKYASYC